MVVADCAAAGAAAAGAGAAAAGAAAAGAAGAAAGAAGAAAAGAGAGAVFLPPTLAPELEDCCGAGAGSLEPHAANATIATVAIIETATNFQMLFSMKNSPF
tara:strand:+ start:1359 stop:1664 length:306 start_codon:yes stop_codon:yes gene_type:complete